MPFDGGARWMIEIAAADKTAQAFSSLDRRLQASEKALKGLGTTVAQQGVASQAGMAAMEAGVALATRALGPLAAGLGAAAAAERIFDAGLKAGSLADQATQLDVSTDLLQSWRLAAAQSGVETKQLDQAILTLTAQMGAANQGNDEVIARFDKLGVKLLDSRGRLRSVSDVLPEVARGLLNVSGQTERNGLSQDLLSTKGARTVSMLESFARGNDEAVRAAKALNTVVGIETIEAWNKFDAQMKVAQQRWDTLLASFGATIVLPGLDYVLKRLEATAKELEGIQRLWDRLTAGPSIAGLQKLEGEAQGRIADLQRLPEGTSKAAMLQQELETLSEIQGKIATLGKAAVTLPEIVVTGDRGGTKNPTGTKAAGAGEKLDQRLKELQTERAALERALAAFEVRGTDTVDEVSRRLDAQVKLDKTIFDALKGVPPNSALAQQLVQEATAVSQLTQKLDERKRLLAAGEQTTAQYGDGSQAAARATKELNDQLAAGAINADTYARAMKASAQAADDQARAARGAKGGADGFIAGVEQGMADLERQNSAFETGKRGVQMLSQELANFATGAETNFGKVLQSFGNMLIMMAAAWASSEIRNLFTGASGAGGAGGSIMNLFGGGGAGGTGAGIFDSLFSFFQGSPFGFANGGDTPVGVPYLVGENGPEVRVDGPGQIFNRQQWMDAQGGGTPSAPTVVINHTNQFGSVVSRAEMEQQLQLVEERSKRGAIAGVLEAKTRGGEYRASLRR